MVTHMYVYIYIIYMCICMRIYIYIHTYVYVYIYSTYWVFCCISVLGESRKCGKTSKASRNPTRTSSIISWLFWLRMNIFFIFLVNYNNSLEIRHKAIFGWFLSKKKIPVRENSEVVIIYSEYWVYLFLIPCFVSIGDPDSRPEWLPARFTSARYCTSKSTARPLRPHVMNQNGKLYIIEAINHHVWWLTPQCLMNWSTMIHISSGSHQVRF